MVRPRSSAGRVNWTRASEYHMTSDEGFTICKFSIGGEWFYEAHMGKRMLETRLASKEMAQAVCVREMLEGKENA